VKASVTTALTEEIWSRSLDDRLIDDDTDQALGETFHEVRIETNDNNLDLVFVDLVAETIQPGYAPFTLGGGGPDATSPHP
jgi:hypothetical protein